MLKAKDIPVIKTRYILAVCGFTKVNPVKLNSGSRKRPLPYARQLICFFLYYEEKLPQMEIAEIFGWTEHSTVSVSVKIINNWLLSNANNVKHDIQAIRELLVPSNADTKNKQP